ncbi:hypothetical protein Aspvir_003284 [Aspergillus viridinutans]|uniref:Zinc-binding loop region of homing endonuclease domain-containing protein n=1 Tax=Aspergillus viridinutans TaxID=75553 RepID=A0A9P3FAD7_ASPVI|nr:uncharacterized protein Aspvir_003284 [Aspergillus viridinutans]GIK07618.1 hypothetical protein Aspvir_003284 [Aspergillus viridinutans]
MSMVIRSGQNASIDAPKGASGSGGKRPRKGNGGCRPPRDKPVIGKKRQVELCKPCKKTDHRTADCPYGEIYVNAGIYLSAIRSAAASDNPAVFGQNRCILEVQIQRHKSEEAGRIDAFTGCWYFTGATNNDGYGQILRKQTRNLGQSGRNAQTAFSMHIIAYVAGHGQDVPAGLQASHLCNNRNCFNPAHIEKETPEANSQRKGSPAPSRPRDRRHAGRPAAPAHQRRPSREGPTDSDRLRAIRQACRETQTRPQSSKNHGRT